MTDDKTLSLKRCAIYTRKSTNHLLDSDINSLVTQREICTAYITSQRYRGWVELPRQYDDGGHSGSRGQRVPEGSAFHDQALRSGSLTQLDECEREVWLGVRSTRNVELLEEQVLYQRNGFAMILLRAEMRDDD